MIPAEWYVLKDFIDASSEGNPQELLSFIHSDEKEVLENISSLPMHPAEGFFSYQEKLEKIHYTWFIPLLEKYAQNDQYLLISSLASFQQEPLYKHFDLSRRPTTIKEFAKEFMRKQLYKLLSNSDAEFLPLECLQEDPLLRLLNLSREEILDAVDLLGLHDLFIELKTLVSSSQLLKITQMLSSTQKEYLFALSKKGEPISFKPMGLPYWNGDVSALKKILHQRGLNRLAKALSYSHSSLVWHLSHKLDMGRASVLKTLIKVVKNEQARQILISQVCDVMEMMVQSA